MENSCLSRGRFKFSLCESRYLGSPLMEWMQGQLAPQQRVAPETQPGCARPPVTTEMRNTNSGPRAPGTPWWAGACLLATTLLT